jgi:flagellar hook protein FlgE
MAKKVFMDPNGHAFASTKDGIHIVTLNGKPYGFINGHSVISHSGVLIGTYKNGRVLDPNGKLIFLVDEKG